MKLLVTGGAGFIGSNFIRLILQKFPDYEITNLDKLTYAGNLDNLKDIKNNIKNKKNYKFVKGDICNAKLVSDLMKNADAVVHFAAETHVDRSLMEAGSFVMTDVFGTFVLLNEAKKNKIRKFVHISTDEVYGSIEKGNFDEGSPLNPANPYSASKAGADRLAYSYYKTFSVPVCIARSSNNFGPYQHPEKFIPLFITNSLEDKKLPLYGDGLNKRDWLYVLDNCEAISLILHNGEDGEVYNVGAGNEKANIYVAKFILKELKKPDSLIEFVKDRLGHDRRYALDCRKIMKLGWKPRYEFEDALRKTVKWYTNNNQWWQKAKSKSFKGYYKKQYGKL